MNEALPDEFDVIVVGTGLPESILSGALSRIGKKVLHLDHCKIYGSSWSSFNLRGFESWVADNNNADQPVDINNLESKINKETEDIIVLKTVRKTIKGGEVTCYLKDKQGKPTDIQIGDASVETTRKTSEKKKENSTVEPDKADVDESTAMCGEESPNTEEEMKTSEGESAGKKVTVEFLTENTGVLKKPPKTDSQTVNELSREYFYSKWRHYNLDLCPKLMFSRGKLVELLVASNVCRYLEFRNVTTTLTLLNQTDATQKLVPVPCSRTDIFNSKLVTMIEKRMLMRVLTICANFENHQDEYKDFEDRPFFEFLASKKLSKKLQHFVIHSIAMINEDANTMSGLKSSQKFLRSLGRYGNSAFLWTTYGIGELPQAFCRLGAVFGGTFCLSRSVKAIITDKADGRCIGIIDSTGQRIKCDRLIMNECYAPESCHIPFKTVVSRAIYVTTKSFADRDGNVSLVTVPPTDNISPTRLIEVGPSCCVCPPNLRIVHGLTESLYESGTLLTSRSQFKNLENLVFDGVGHLEDQSELRRQSEELETENDDLEPKVKDQESTLPRILWAAYFVMLSNGVDLSRLPKNVLVTKSPGMELGFDETVTEARCLFETVCPDEEFLPRAPNPDEIIYFDQNDEGYSTETNGSNPVSHPAKEIGEYQEDANEDAGSGEPSVLEEGIVSISSTDTSKHKGS